MRTPAEYVQAVLLPKRQGSQTLVLRVDAEAAVAAALADAEKYRTLLLRALRHSAPCDPPPASC